MKKTDLNRIIREELQAQLKNENLKLTNETYDLDQVKYSASVKTQVDKLVNAIEKTPNLSKQAVASILNDIILALGLDRTQITMYINMIKVDRAKMKF